MLNCTTSVEGGDLVVVSALRGSTAFLCSVISVLLLTSVSIRLDKSQLLHRLIISLTVSSLLVLLSDLLQGVSAFCYAPWYPPTCVVVGFVSQLTSWLLLLVGVWLGSVLSLRYWCPNHREALGAKSEAGVWLGIVILSVLAAVIPLGTGGYGLNQTQCWLKENRYIEQWLLWYSWMVVAPVVAIVMLTIAMCQSEKRQRHYYESSRGINSVSQQRCKAAAKKLKRLICYITVYWGFVTLATVLYQIPQVRNEMPFLVTTAILEPLGVLVTSVVLIVHFHEPRRSRVHAEDFRLTNSEGSISINTSCEGEGGKGGREGWRQGRKKAKSSKKQDDSYPEALRESLLLTKELPDEFDQIT